MVAQPTAIPQVDRTPTGRTLPYITAATDQTLAYQAAAVSDVRAYAVSVPDANRRGELFALAERAQGSLDDAARLTQLESLDADLLTQHMRVKDECRHLRTLLADRRYGRTTTPEDLHEDLPGAAFSVALDAIRMALDTAADREGMARALRTALNMTIEDRT